MTLKIVESYQQSTYIWTRLGNLESSGGICPLIELLFMWLFKKKKIKRNKNTKKKKRMVKQLDKQPAVFGHVASENSHKCFVLFKFANDLGSGPDM